MSIECVCLGVSFCVLVCFVLAGPALIGGLLLLLLVSVWLLHWCSALFGLLLLFWHCSGGGVLL